MVSADDRKCFLDETSSLGKDEFGIHSNIADAILGIIKDYNQAKDSSFTIGIFGNWGSGKSFIVDRIRKKLEQNKDIACFYVDAWKFVGNSLYRRILLSIENQLDRNKFFISEKLNLKQRLYENETYQESETKWHWSVSGCVFAVFFLIFCIWTVYSLYYFFLPYWKITNSPNDFLSLLATIIKDFILPFFIGLGGIIWGFFYQKEIKHYTSSATFSAEQFEKIFKEDIIDKILEQNKNAKIIFIFDNIDRCTPDCAYETLSTIKTFMDQKNCMYIIPCDDEAIKDHLKSKMAGCTTNENYAGEFMDKIFNTYFRIPEIKTLDRDAFIFDKLDSLQSVELEDEEKTDIKQVMYHAYKLNTPREIKRFINDFVMYYQIAKVADLSLPNDKKLLKHKVLFAIMIVIKQKWQFAEKDILENNNYLKKYYNGFINTLNNKEYEVYKVFLGKIGPLIKKYNYFDVGLESYIYLKEFRVESMISDALIEGNKIDISSKHFAESFLKDANEKIEESTNQDNALLSLILTIKNATVKYQKKQIIELISATINDMTPEKLKEFLSKNEDKWDDVLSVLIEVKCEKKLIELAAQDQTEEKTIEFRIIDKIFNKVDKKNLDDIFHLAVDDKGLKNAILHKNKYIDLFKKNKSAIPHTFIKKSIDMLNVKEFDSEIIELLNKIRLDDNSKPLLKDKLLETARDYGQNGFNKDFLGSGNKEIREAGNKALTPFLTLVRKNLIKDLLSEDEFLRQGKENIKNLFWYLHDSKPQEKESKKEDKQEYIMRFLLMSDYFSLKINDDTSKVYQDKTHLDCLIQIIENLINTDEMKKLFIEQVTIEDLKNIFEIPEAKQKILKLAAGDLYAKFAKIKQLKNNYDLFLEIPIKQEQLELFKNRMGQDTSRFTQKTKFKKFVKENYDEKNKVEIIEILKNIK